MNTGHTSENPGVPTPFERAMSAAVALSQAAITTALLYYFGLAYTRAWYGHFGVSPRQLDYGVTDYIVVSINGFFPVLLGLLAFAGLLALHTAPTRIAARTREPRRTLRMWIVSAAGTGIALCTAVAICVAVRDHLPRTLDLIVPILLLAGVTLTGHAMQLRPTLDATPDHAEDSTTNTHSSQDQVPDPIPAPPPVIRLSIVYQQVSRLRQAIQRLHPPLGQGPNEAPTVHNDNTTDPPATAAQPATPSWLLTLTLLLLGFLGAFWTVNNFAVAAAHQDANDTEHSGFPGLPVVVLYAVDRLAIEGRHVRVGQITTPGEKYRYQYSGLLLLTRTNSGYFLIPYDWSTSNNDRVFIITPSDNIRIDIAPHPVQ